MVYVRFVARRGHPFLVLLSLPRRLSTQVGSQLSSVPLPICAEDVALLGRCEWLAWSNTWMILQMRIGTRHHPCATDSLPDPRADRSCFPNSAGEDPYVGCLHDAANRPAGRTRRRFTVRNGIPSRGVTASCQVTLTCRIRFVSGIIADVGVNIGTRRALAVSEGDFPGAIRGLTVKEPGCARQP